MLTSEKPVPLLDAAQVIEEERRLLLPNGPADAPLAALCLSGGGIRSATFGLGVLQTLARYGLLGDFHYLSTVSGGGYIGSWLTAWRTRRQDDAEVFAHLKPFSRPNGSEPTEIEGLRANSNYLTPKLGILSADTWAALALILRNLLLNWLVFGPLFMGALFLPKLLASLLGLLGLGSYVPSAVWLCLAMVTAVGGLASAVRGRMQAAGRWLKDGTFLWRVGVPLAVAALLATAGSSAWPAIRLPVPALYGGLGGAVCYAAAWCVGFRLWRGSSPEAERKQGWKYWQWDCAAFTLAGLVAGACMGAGAYLVGSSPPSSALLTVLGPAWALFSFALGDVAFVGANSFAARGDSDREWLARYGGWLLAAAATMAVGSAVDFYMPVAIHLTWGRGTAFFSSLGISGAVTLLLGPSSLTGATASRRAGETIKLSTLVSVAAIVFAACLAGVLSALDDRLVCVMPGVGRTLSDGLGCTTESPGATALWQFAGFAVLTAFACGASWLVNVNRFSLHALYRNRLVRAFLGSAREREERDRGKDPFSGFDAADNLHMATTLPVAGPHGVRLLHVVNMTLNLVGGRNLAWQERKAESFTVTALHCGCGNKAVGYRPTAEYGDRNGGITLGTAMAISGAAVSPNSGYHSSPLVGVLLTLFNLRLGWWLGNPKADRFRNEGPQPGLLPTLAELAGQTNDEGRWIYMSDGGHFENLGIYEMVRRRCRRIVVSDAGCDPESAFEDLGNAVRKVYIDFGVSIDFHTLDIPARRNPAEPGLCCAVGTIRYPEGGPDGWLLYMKPGYRGVEPAHVRSYANAHAAFPHESTAEQWFTESQFEAYRALGAFITERVCNGGRADGPNAPLGPMALDDLKAQAELYVASHKRPLEDRPVPVQAVPAQAG